MRRLRALAVAVGFLASACAAGGGPPERVVRVDHRNDEFASFYWRYFPRTIEAHPGDTLVFRTEWTGEPHTVTFGTLADRALQGLADLERRYGDLDPGSPELEAAAREYEELLEGLPVLDTYAGMTAQNAMQPCYLRSGVPPADPDVACPPDAQIQPPFDGRHAFYSSGFLVPERPTGTEFRMELSDDIEPGTYSYYCIIHMPVMQGELLVRPPSEPVPDQGEVSRRTRAEIEALASPLREAMTDAQAGRARTGSADLALPLAGYHAGDEYTVQIAEFVPRRINTHVGEPVTWTVVGAHTISFDVPPYMPIYLAENDGNVRRNPEVDRAAGGSPDPPLPDFTSGPLHIDGGTWDGRGFFSSGLLGAEPYATYTVRFSRPGRYRFACLVHPPMVGTVVVAQ